MAFSSAMQKGLESPEGDFDKVTQSIFDEIDFEDTEKN